MNIFTQLARFNRRFQPTPTAGRLASNGSSEPFIFTEIYQCGKIGKIALESLIVHHPTTPIHIFGTPDDFVHVPKHDQFVLHDLTSEQKILKNFNWGHLGTASLWAKIILERPERYLIHFDSDVIFRAPVFPMMVEKLQAGFSLVGPRRNYQHNPNKNDAVRWLSDVTQTVCFGFDREKITNRNYQTLTKMCQGALNPSGHPVIDFFDPVSFDVLRNGGTAFFLDEQDFGGCDAYGRRDTTYPELNAHIDFGKRLAHFSAVGSGMNYFHHRAAIGQHVPRTYVDYAIEKYAVFCKIFYHESLDVRYDQAKYAALLTVKNWYNQPGTSA